MVVAAPTTCQTMSNYCGGRLILLIDTRHKNYGGIPQMIMNIQQFVNCGQHGLRLLNSQLFAEALKHV